MNHLYFLKSIGIKYYFDPRILDSKKNIKENLQKNSITVSKKHTSSSLPKSATTQELLFINNILSVAEENLINSTSQVRLVNARVENIVKNVREQIKSINSLEELKKYVMDFEYCSLKFFANNTVFADGNPNASVMVIGEAPGENEDKYAIPFCGRSGALLDKILYSINLSRKNNVYITNTVFWRPPANRRPSLEEIEICRPIVEKHISLISPKLIVLAGNTAIKSLLSSDQSITQLQGNFICYKNIYLYAPMYLSAIFHPSYLLRQPNKKKDTWRSILKIHKILKNIK